MDAAAGLIYHSVADQIRDILRSTGHQSWKINVLPNEERKRGQMSMGKTEKMATSHLHK